MKKQIAVTLTILTAVAVYAFVVPHNAVGSADLGKNVSLHDAYKNMMQMVPFTFSGKKAPPVKPVS